MVNYEKPYDGSPSQSDDTSSQEKASHRRHDGPHDEFENTSHEFDVYGDETNADIKYRTMDWQKAAALMLAETVSLGVRLFVLSVLHGTLTGYQILSIPSVFVTLGMVGGCIAVIVRDLHNQPSFRTDVEKSGTWPYSHSHWLRPRPIQTRSPACSQHGRCGRGPVRRIRSRAFGYRSNHLLDILGWIACVDRHDCVRHQCETLSNFYVQYSRSAHPVTNGASCSVVWAAVTAIICMFLTMIRTLSGISYLSVASFASVFSASEDLRQMSLIAHQQSHL